MCRPLPHRAALLLALLALAPGCRKAPDETRLQEALDSVPVHLYLAAKVAASGTSPDAATGQAAQGEGRRAPGAPAAGAGTEDARKGPAALSLETLEGSLRRLAERGEALARADRSGELPPVLPTLLADVTLPRGLKEALDAQTEHAVLLVSFSALKLHPDLPVPFPSEVVLYEAWKTDPERVRIPGFGRHLRALKAYTYAMNGYCDLASGEVERLRGDGARPDPRALARGLGLVSGRAQALTREQVRHLNGLPHALGYGSVAICYSLRGAEDKGRTALAEFLNGETQRELKGPEMELLRAYVECTGGTPEEGLARLKRVAAQGDLREESREDLALLQRHYAAGKAEPLASVASASRIARAVARASAAHLERSGTAALLRQAEWLQPVRGFGDSVGAAFAAAQGAVPAVPGVVERVTSRLGQWLP